MVLKIMRDRQIIDEERYQQAMAAPLVKVGQMLSGFNRFPAFLDLVRRQLKEDYREEDLNSSGLKILTTLDPQVQWQVEKQLARTLDGLEKQKGRSRSGRGCRCQQPGER